MHRLTVGLVLSALSFGALAGALTSRGPSVWQTRSFSLDALNEHYHQLKRQAWGLSQPGTTGVLAMQMVVISPSQLLLLDRVENNPLQINGHSAWSAIYSLSSNSARPVSILSNSFCAGSSFLSNGTLVSIGGYIAEQANIPDTNGFQALRLFNPSQCPDDGTTCSFIENPARIRLAKPRWYPTSVRLQDGSLLIIGGSNAANFINSPTINEPSFEHYPPKNVQGSNGLPIPSKFLNDTLNANLFPIAYLLPGGKVFVAVNQQAMLYDWRSNSVQNLPRIPNGVRITYPLTGTGILLPLTYQNNYTPTMLICGGQANSDTVPPSQMSSQQTASAQCARMELSTAGIQAGWSVDMMPDPRVMPDATILPDGRVLIVNGGRSGYAGYGNVRQQVGQSNADNPVFRGVIYNPSAPQGSRFSADGLPASTIARLYHSVSTLVPSGEVVIAGSSPHGDVSNVKYPTEYRLEVLSPPYMSKPRPTFSAPAAAGYGQILFMRMTVPVGTKTIQAVLLDLGFSTHSVHMDMRAVFMNASITSDGRLMVAMPPDSTMYPPGPAWMFVLADGVPSKGTKLLMGGGGGPPVNQAALDNMLAKTRNPA